MPLFTPYFSLDSSAFRVGNGGRLRCRMGASGIGIYVMLLSHLRDCRDCRAPLDYDMLAFDLHEDAAAVRRVVEEFGLFDIDRSSGTFTSSVLTTVRGMLSDDASAAGGGTVRTVRQRRVRSAGETYRRAVRRLAEDNALPPAEEEAPAEGDAEPAEVKNEPAEELPTSSENEITPAEGEPQPAELDAQPADEENATGDFAPTSIAAEAEPAEVKHEADDADAAPSEGERELAEEENIPTAFADAHSPKTEENRKEQNKKPHTPIVPFPQSGKGTRASHPAAAVVGAQEEGDASAEGDEEPVVGNPLSIPSASAERDAPPCATAPTVLGAPAQPLDPHPSTSIANGASSAENKEMSTNHSQPNPLTESEAPAHPSPDTAKADTSVPNGETSTEKGEMSTNHSQPNSLTASEKNAHPNPDTGNGTTSVPNGTTSAEKMETSTNHSQPNPLTASEKTTHPNPDTAKADTSVPNSQANPENGQTSVPNGQTNTTNSPTSTTDAQSNTLTTSEKADEAGRGEEGAVEPFVPPTANEVRRFAETLHHPEFDAEWFVAYYTERHWRRHNGRPVVSWQTTARYWLDHPLRVARHLLDHRPAANPVSVGVGTASAVVVPPAGTTAAKPVGTSTHPAAGPTSSTSTGTHPVGTGAPHVGSLSLPAPTPLQQSRLSDLKGMVLHLFADAPAAVPASASTSPDLSSDAPDVPAAAADVSASASTPDWVARNSVRPARVLSPAEAAQVIAQQTLASAEAEAVPRVVHDSTADAEEIIDTQASPTNAAEEEIETQALSPADAEESIRACGDSTDNTEEEIGTQAFSTADAAKDIDAQSLSPADAKESIRACDNSTDEDGEGIDAQAFSTPDAANNIETQAISPADAEASVPACDNSTADAAKGIETQVLSPADAEKSVRSCDDSTDEDGNNIETQALSPADAEASVRACDNSTDEDGEEIDAQAFSTTDTEESVHACDDSTTDNAKYIETQAFSTADAEEDALNGHDYTTDTAEGIETQALSPPDAAGSLGALPFSTDKGRWGVRSPRGPDPPTDDGHDSNAIRHAGTDTGNDFADAENNFTAKPSSFSADRHPPAAVGTALAADPPIFVADVCRPLRTLTEKHPYLNPSFHEPHPLLRLHPPSFGGFGRTFRVQSAQPPFSRPFLGRFVDIRPACTVGSRPLRPRLARCRPARGRCRPEHADRERTTATNAAERSANAIRPAANAPKHADDGRKRHDPAPERSADAISPLADGHEHGAQCAKNADFIDVDPVRGHKIDRNEPEHADRGCKRHDPAPEHPTNAVSPLADAPEHTADGRKRHDPAPEHTADDYPDPAYDPDAGQRVLRSAAHRRAVRAEREACCGALRHLAHCCVAF